MQIYNIAVICLQRNQMDATRNALAKCFDHVEELFFMTAQLLVQVIMYAHVTISVILHIAMYAHIQ